MSGLAKPVRELAAAYIKFCAVWHKHNAAPDGPVADDAEHEWVFDEVMDLTCERPHELLDFVLETLALEPPTETLEMLAAGPLEDYLATHGDEVIEDVEKLAKSNPKFASLLGGVWKNSMSDDVWKRVQAVWDRRGWDGNPS
jgi:hypothetical protein